MKNLYFKQRQFFHLFLGFSDTVERKAPTFFPTFKQLDNLKNDSNMIRTSAEKQQIF